ncbi:MAG TPA: ABC transporter permease [Nocardioidaceae bacterium]|nr:ABC transporter permease [Nocardioidaceae bacterium]
MSAPPIEPGGPYAGTVNRVVAYVPGSVRSVVDDAGGMAQLMVGVLWSAVRHPRGYWSDVVDEMHYTVKRSWLSITIALAGFLIALSVPAMQFITLAGVGELYGPMLLTHSTRTFTVWVASLLVAGVIGASITAELGSRKVREELDAMQVMGIDPIRTLVVPRVVSVTLITTLLSIPALFITIGTMQFSAKYIGGLKSAEFYDWLWLAMSTTELVMMVVNCLIAGLLIGVVCCYKGLNASGGAMGLGKAVNQAVVISFVSLFVFQLGYNALVLGFFPDLGTFR